MSTRDDDNEHNSVPSGRTGYRFPLRDRRFENTVVEEPEDEGDDEVFDRHPDADTPVHSDGGDNPANDSTTGVRVRTRRRSTADSNAAISNGASSGAQDAVPAAVSPDDVDDDPGIQEQDAPVARGRIAQAASRARNVNLNDRGPRTAPGRANPQNLTGRTTFHNGNHVSMDNRSLEEFDAQFIEETRRVLGEGFIPQSQLPGDFGDRVRHIVTVCNVYAKEFILDQLERMVVAKVPVDTIAARFRVTVPTIIRWRGLLRKRWAEKVQTLKQGNLQDVIGEHLAQFEMRIAIGMSLVQKPEATLQEITKGLEIVERAQTNMIKYQDMLGLHDSKPLAVSNDSANAEDKRVKDAKSLTNAISDLFGIATAFPVAGDMGDKDLEEEDEYRVNE